MTLECAKFIIELVGGIIAVSGAFFAIFQWKKGNDYKRAEIVQQLIVKLNDDDDIALVLEMIDWTSGFWYDGEFNVDEGCEHVKLENKQKEDLFNLIDKTLSHCSFICYLYLRKCLTKKDMNHFDYTINSLIRNQHIRNYLFTIYHFAKSRETKCAFHDLIEYAIKKKYLDKCEFANPNSSCFELCLEITQ